MGRQRTPRQGDFLVLMEPGPALAPSTRVDLIPLLAALLLETLAVDRLATDKREEGDDQDRA